MSNTHLVVLCFHEQALKDNACRHASHTCAYTCSVDFQRFGTLIPNITLIYTANQQCWFNIMLPEKKKLQYNMPGR